MIGLATIVQFSACSSVTGQSNALAMTTTVDTTKSFRVGEYWVTPKQWFDLNSVIDSCKDTLRLISCAEFVYSPFGKFNSKADIKRSHLLKFVVTSKVDTMDNGSFEFQRLRYKASRLILCFDNDPEASKQSSILKGEINNSEIHLLNNISVGMEKEKFFKVFFDNYPNKLLPMYDCITIESCVEDIVHTYKFNGNKLQSIIFTTDCVWNLNY